jgi:hypothetical protein
MLNLYDTEKKRAGLFSSYFQSLIELMVSVRLFEHQSKIAERKAQRKERRTQQGDALSLAIQLAQTFQDEVNKPATSTLAKPPSPPKTPSQPADDAGSDDQSEEELLKAALAASLQGQGGDAGDQPSSAPAVDLSALIGEGNFDDDEDLSAAIAMSLGQSAEMASTPAKQTGEEKMDVDKPASSAPSTPASSTAGKADSSSVAASASVDESEGADESMDDDYVGNLFDSAAIPPPPPSGLKGSKSGIMAPPAETDPQWFAQVVHVAQALECLLQRDATDEYQNELLMDLVKKAWTEARKDTIRERIMLLEGLPAAPADKLPELTIQLEELFDDVAMIAEGSVYWPVDKETKQTKTHAFVELLSVDKFKNALTKINKQKWKVCCVAHYRDDDSFLRVSRFRGPSAQGCARFIHLESCCLL